MCFWNIQPTSVPSSQLKSGLANRRRISWIWRLQPHCSFPSHIQYQNQKPKPCLPIFVVSRSSPVAPKNISDCCALYERQTWHPPDTIRTWSVHERWCDDPFLTP